MALPASDSFVTSTDQSIESYSSNWTRNYGTNNGFQVLAASDCASPTAADECAAHWNADTFDNDQYAEVVMDASGAAQIGPAVRCAAGASANYYHFYLRAAKSYVGKMSGGSWTQLAPSGPGGVAGSTYRVEVSGTTITPYKDGSVFSIGAQTDSTHTSGYAGIAGWNSDTGSRISSWEGGNLSGTTYNQSAAGSVTPSGVVARFVQKTLIGSVSPSGTVQRLSGKILTGTVGLAGALAAIRTAFVSAGGVLGLTGTLAIQTMKSVSGSLSPSGALARRVDKILAGALAPSGALAALVIGLYTQAVGGTLAMSGALVRSVSKSLSGGIAPTGSLAKLTSKILAGALGLAGSMIHNLFGPSGWLADVTLADDLTYTVALDSDLTYAVSIGNSLIYTVALEDEPA